MSKVLAVNFDDSNEDLYRWIISNNDPDELIIRLLRQEMNKKSQKTTFTLDELAEISKRAKDIFGDDRANCEAKKEDDEELFNPDFFRMEQKKETMISIDEIINHFK